MQTITPSVAAQLADNIYRITNDFEAEGFLQRKEFSSGESDKAILTADVGSRLIQVSDGFGVCARGAGNYKIACR